MSNLSLHGTNSGPGNAKKRVSYFYHSEVGHHYYGPAHPMKPHRLKLAHHLILSYGLYQKMECYRPHLATAAEVRKKHADNLQLNNYIRKQLQVLKTTRTEQ